MKIALFQMTAGIDPAQNVDELVQAIEAAAAAGAAMIFTPEMSGLLDSNRQRARTHIRTEEEDPVLDAVRAAARRAGIWVHLGSLALQGPEKLANRGFVIDDQGAIKARYDKQHLFDVDLPTGESSVVATTPLGALGLSICYDIRFGALYQALSNAGAEILSVPAAFTVPTGEAHWHVLLRARAIENACWVVAAAQTGLHEDGRQTYGHSMAVDPWGDIVLDMGKEPGLGFADISLSRVQEVRGRVPVIAHRRPIPPVETAS
jgi:predicted amidohydrolase